eukprot:CAMPEP_0178989406 /NCGR_PEP_ID=MMETSP0795-20121207/4344_1 /TAXON_ID=88552 /ORGANISM="Amoebophrya sp., Strain Ameob2" /LENGTH=124 /DNA_ID=CAMNT_0020680779 /DNA_START=116 /DNA_END=490 /DNA_ORIENTATION=-
MIGLLRFVPLPADLIFHVVQNRQGCSPVVCRATSYILCLLRVLFRVAAVVVVALALLGSRRNRISASSSSYPSPNGPSTASTPVRRPETRQQCVCARPLLQPEYFQHLALQPSGDALRFSRFRA